jgi:hypothetical protein
MFGGETANQVGSYVCFLDDSGNVAAKGEMINDDYAQIAYM